MKNKKLEKQSENEKQKKIRKRDILLTINRNVYKQY